MQIHIEKISINQLLKYCWLFFLFVNWPFMTSLFFFSLSIATKEKPCALFCTPSGKDQPILLTEKVMDGTSCGQHGLDICADGRCQVWITSLETGHVCTCVWVQVFVMNMYYFSDGMLQSAWPRLNVYLCFILKYFKLSSLIGTHYLK